MEGPVPEPDAAQEQGAPAEAGEGGVSLLPLEGSTGPLRVLPGAR